MIAEAEALAHSLGAKPAGKGKWQAPCPFHDDKKPSLSIQEGKDRKTVVTCHAGCEDVFERLISEGYFPTNADRDAKLRPEETYAYTSKDGELLFEVVRLPGKKFRARCPDGAGGWSWRVPEDRRVPYRLPEVLAADEGQLIVIVEGEKDADRLAEHGYTATTNPFGAGKWRKEYNEHFRNRTVVIVPDNDEAGRTHAEHVRVQLEPVAASVRVLSLDSHVDEKGDVSDLIDAQGIDGFKRLTEQLPPAIGRQKPYHTLADLDRLPRREWLVDGMLPKKGLALIFGDSGVGKSFVALDLCVRVALGQPAHGRETKPGLAIYVALEGETGLRDRLVAAALQAGQRNPSDLNLGVIPRALDLCSADSVTGLIGAIMAAARGFDAQPALVVIDTLSRAMPGANENSPDEMNRAIGGLTRIQKETGATVLTVHHSGKTAERGARGHSSLRAAMDTELHVARDKRGKYLEITKQRDGEDQIRFGFELTPAQVSAPDHQGTIETRVVRATGQSPADETRRLRPTTDKFRQALQAALEGSARRASDEDAERLEVPPGTPLASRADWLEKAREMSLSKSDAGLRKALSRASEELEAAGLLHQAGDLCWLPNAPGILGRREHGQAGTGQT